MPPPCAVITPFLGKTRDRFSEYNEDQTLEQKFARVASIPGLSGVECIHPYETGEAAGFRALLLRHGLRPAAINVNIKAEPEFRAGSLSALDPETRARAVKFIHAAKDFAAEVGADKVTCCPLSDGYEFAFQHDYRQAWAHLVETVAAGASYRPEIPLFIEYKPSETRGRCYLDTAARTLCLLKDTGCQGLGVTLDYGHSKYGGENPAETACLIAASGRPLYVHINDNNGRWDWDYMAASHNLLEYMEFLWWLQELGYRDFLTADASPTRWPIEGFFEANTRLTLKLWTLLENIDRTAFRNLIAKGEFLSTWRFVEQHLFKL